MMAKMFYTMDETKVALGKNEEEIKQFAREGRLREFRDGPRLMFKADQVETLKAEMGGGRRSGGPALGQRHAHRSGGQPQLQWHGASRSPIPMSAGPAAHR